MPHLNSQDPICSRWRLNRALQISSRLEDESTLDYLGGSNLIKSASRSRDLSAGAPGEILQRGEHRFWNGCTSMVSSEVLHSLWGPACGRQGVAPTDSSRKTGPQSSLSGTGICQGPEWASKQILPRASGRIPVWMTSLFQPCDTWHRKPNYAMPGNLAHRTIRWKSVLF